MIIDDMWCDEEDGAQYSKERNLVDEIVRLKLDLAGWRDRKFARFANEDCWVYQGDGSDDLDSLVCPVVVKPQVLSELLTNVAKVEGRLQGLRELCGYIEEGGGEPITIFQDDATKDWILRIGGPNSARWYNSTGFNGVIDVAITAAQGHQK